MKIQLSRGFSTVPQGLPVSNLAVKSVAALLLGVIPFTVHTISRNAFKAIASGGDAADQHGYTFLRQIVGVIGVPTAAIMCVSAKLFAVTQLFIWGHYVRHPEGDGANTRLAFYGADQLPWQDLHAITHSFFSRDGASPGWTLKQWSRIQL